MKSLMLTVLFVLFFTISAAAAELVPLLPDTPAEPLRVTVQNESPSGLSLSVSASAILSEPMPGDAAGHVRLSWDDSGIEGRAGEPEIPVRRFWIAIPRGAMVRAAVTASTWNEYDLSSLTGSPWLMPVQPPVEKRAGVAAPFTKDPPAYSRNSYGDRPAVEVEEYAVVRGQQLALVSVRPVQYNPASGTVRIATELRLRLDFDGGDPALTEQKALRYQNPMAQTLLHDLVINPQDRELDELPASLGYLVISVPDQNYNDALEPFLEWKKNQGWVVTHVTTDTTGTTTAQIKSYIQTAYDTWDVPPSFILMVGDTPGIPNWTGQGAGSPPTDLNYVQLEGADYIADAGIGRFSMANLADLENMINKTMQYEKVLWNGGDTWVTHSNWMASVDNYQISEGTHNFVLNNYVWPAGFTADRLYQVSFGATTQDVTNSFNAGVSLGTYSGHGSETSWADGPPFSQANVNALTNSVYPFVQSYACLTGAFQTAECFAETWLRHSSGAMAMMASSVTSYWNEDDILERRVYEGFFNNLTPNDPYNITWINGMVDYGKLRLYEYYGNTSTVRRYFEMYNIFGDGSVDLWTAVPQDITVNHPAAFFLGDTELDLSVTDAPCWARVCVMSSSEPDIMASGFADENGNITITLPSAPTLPGTLDIYVTGHNINPYQAHIPLTAAEGPYVVFESVSVNDAAGWNPNGQLDYDETALLTVTIQNVGVENSHDPTAVTLSDVQNVLSFSDGYEAYPAVPAGGSVTIDNGFALSVNPDVQDGLCASVPVFITDSWDFWNSVMPLTLHAAAAEVSDVAFDDSPGGNGNNWLDPGEDAWITLTLTNNGSAPIVEGYARLTEDGDPYVTVTTDNVEYFPALNPGQSVETGWGIMAAANCPQDYDMTLRLDLDADHGITMQINIPITVGDILFLPSGPDVYGYSMYDPHDGNNALPCNWVEISPAFGGSGTDTGISADDQSVHLNLPFTFNYYGAAYTGFTVDSNGWIALGAATQSSDYSNSDIPNADGPSAMIAPYWEDLNPSRVGCDGIYWYHDQVQHRYIVEWSHIDQYTPAGNFETFEVILYDPVFHPTGTGDGIIQFQYLDVTGEVGNDGTVGVESPNETDGVEYVYQTTWDIHATPITDGFSITTVTSMGEPLTAPTNLSYTLSNNGQVTLDWDFAGMHTLEALTNPVVTLPGDKADVMREEDRLQLLDWQQNGVPGNELDEFLHFNVYRNNEVVGTPTLTTFQETLTEHGDYSYFVTAQHDEGESIPSNVVTFDYQPAVTLTITPISTFIMPGGGTVRYSAHLVSTLPNPVQNVDYWTMITLPNGNRIGPVFSTTFNMPAFADMTVPMISQNVPANAPAGDYLHECFVGNYPGVIGAMDSFTFMKAGATAGGKINLDEWTCSGWYAGESALAVGQPLPQRFEVGRAYPNPFNVTVSLPYALPNSGVVEVALFNVLGQRVLTHTIQQSAGFHTLTIDGSSLSSGVYLLSVNGFAETHRQKVMLLK